MVFSTANSFIIKHVYECPRLEEALRLITEGGYSPPSGHATSVAALFVSLVLVLTTTRVGRHLRYLLQAAALTFTVFICVTRLYLGVHWVTDVIGDFSAGLGPLIILAPFMTGPNALKLFRQLSELNCCRRRPGPQPWALVRALCMAVRGFQWCAKVYVCDRFTLCL